MYRWIAKGGSAIALTLALGAATFGGTAQAAQGNTQGNDKGAAATSADGGLLAEQTTRAKSDRAGKYWTKDRMRSARALDNGLSRAEVAKLGKQRSNVTAGKALAVAGEAPASSAGSAGLAGTADAQRCDALAATTSSSRYYGCQWHYRTQGKLFFHDPAAPEGKDNFVCSATVVTSGNKSTVLTAGHCVKNTSRNWYDQHVFVPAYDNGAAPYGKWTARRLATTERWGLTASPQWNYDVGFVVVNTNAAGATIQDTVGATGIAFGQARNQQNHAFGYPQAAPYNGQEPYYCAGKSFTDTYYGTNGLACKMTGGASGGGWVIKLNLDLTQGYLNSVNSYKNNLNPNVMYGPYFGTAAANTYQLAAGA